MQGPTKHKRMESAIIYNVYLPEETDGRGRASEATSAGKKQKAKMRMTWDLHKDLILVGEVLLARPFQHPLRTRERGRAWQEVAAAMQSQNLKVDKRSVRERISSLMYRVRDESGQEKAASGISVEETDEEKKLREIVEEFIREEMDIKSTPREKGDEEKKKADGAEMRKQACETFRETRKSITWDLHKDLILVGEVKLARPFQHPLRTRERGRAWQEVAAAMQSHLSQNLKVGKRSVRERISSLMYRVRDKNRREKAAGGISETDKEKKLRESVEEFIQEELDIKSALREKGDEEKKKVDGAEMRKRAWETFRETQKRHGEESGTTPKRSRDTGDETVVIVQRMIEIEQETRRVELARRREEEESRRQEERERDRRYELLQQQQMQQERQFQQHQQQMQQQQQVIQQQLLNHQQVMLEQAKQSQTIMEALLKALEKKD